MNTQFVLRDVKPRAEFRGQRKHLDQYWATWQSGLLFADGRPKPAFQAYLMPFDAHRHGPTVQMWGQLKFFPNFQPADVYLQFRPAGSPTWRFGGGPFHVVNGLGYWTTEVTPPGPGVWRSVVFLGGQAVTSREVSVPF
jgi:hypothetical protein